MDINQSGSFSQLLGNKVAYAGRRTDRSTKTTKRSDWTCNKGRAWRLLRTMHCGFFQWSLRADAGTSTLTLATTMRFSSHTEERKLTLGKINEGAENAGRKRGINTVINGR